MAIRNRPVGPRRPAAGWRPSEAGHRAAAAGCARATDTRARRPDAHEVIPPDFGWPYIFEANRPLVAATIDPNIQRRALASRSAACSIAATRPGTGYTPGSREGRHYGQGWWQDRQANTGPCRHPRRAPPTRNQRVRVHRWSGRGSRSGDGHAVACSRRHQQQHADEEAVVLEEPAAAAPQSKRETVVDRPSERRCLSAGQSPRQQRRPRPPSPSGVATRICRGSWRSCGASARPSRNRPPT